MVENDLYLKNVLALQGRPIPVITRSEKKQDEELSRFIGEESITKGFFTIKQFKQELNEALEIIKIRSATNGNKNIYNIYLEAGIDASSGFSNIQVYSGDLIKLFVVPTNDELSLIMVLVDYYNCCTNFKEAEEEMLEWQSYIHEPVDVSNRICYTTNGLKPQIVETTHDYIYNVELFGESLLRNYLLNSIERDGKEYTIMLDPSKENSCDFIRDNTYILVAVDQLLKTVDVIK